MKKNGMVWLLALLMAFATVFAFAEDAEDPVLAHTVDDSIVLRKSDLQKDYDETLAYLLTQYSQQGYPVDEYDTEFQAYAAQYTAEGVMSRRVIEQWAGKEGYVLTAEREAELVKEAEDAVAQAREYYSMMLSMYYGFSGEELEKTVNDLMAQSGYTAEAYLDSARFNDVLDFVQEIATADVAVTPEEVRAAFDEKVSSQKESFAQVDAYLSAAQTEEKVYWTPEGVRTVQLIYVAKPSEKEENADETASAETESASGQPDAAGEADQEESTAETGPLGQEKAEAARAELLAGADFAEVVGKYDESGAPTEQVTKGVQIAAGATNYAEEIVNAAMALSAPGEVSPVVETENMFVVLRYLADVPAGEAAYDTAMEESETSALLSQRKQEAYTAFVQKVIAEAGVEYHDFSSLYHVYAGTAAEAVTAYAAVKEDTELFAKPEGSAVAKLSAGASLDVLGKVTVDGKEWSFTAVPGTEFKGYLPSGALTSMEEAEALATDNSALAAAAESAEEHPVFTIVMNDGAVIYGELYPETAPESVGNFADLARSGFYDGLIFHRVIAGFMIQGGDPLGTGIGGPGYSIKGEFSANGIENPLKHTRGVLSMARSQDMDSAGSQFFIMHADSDFLDGQYAAFGLVLGGMDEVDVIASVPTDSNDKPRVDQQIRMVWVETNGKEYTFTKLGE
ncbi:MAG: peptidylprolyl isomerase [Clostridiales bacterium]|nr:peptidylprolyl isomerase [Clostridiales bacterium]